MSASSARLNVSPAPSGQQQRHGRQRPARDQQPGDSAGDRQQQRLGEKLATMCLRPAPIDRRTAISVDRRAARPSSRLATFAQQISSTIIVTLNSSVSGWRDSLRHAALAASARLELHFAGAELFERGFAHAFLERHLHVGDDGAVLPVQRFPRLFARDSRFEASRRDTSNTRGGLREPSIAARRRRAWRWERKTAGGQPIVVP